MANLICAGCIKVEMLNWVLIHFQLRFSIPSEGEVTFISYGGLEILNHDRIQQILLLVIVLRVSVRSIDYLSFAF